MDEREREIREDEALWADLEPPATIRYLLSLLDREREQKAELLEALEDMRNGARGGTTQELYDRVDALLTKHKETA